MAYPWVTSTLSSWYRSGNGEKISSPKAAEDLTRLLGKDQALGAFIGFRLACKEKRKENYGHGSEKSAAPA
jgi:hypothetical protein